MVLSYSFPPLDLHILHCHSCDLKCPHFSRIECGSGRTERISLTLDLNGQVTSLLWDSVPSFIKWFLIFFVALTFQDYSPVDACVSYSLESQYWLCYDDVSSFSYTDCGLNLGDRFAGLGDTAYHIVPASKYQEQKAGTQTDLSLALSSLLGIIIFFNLNAAHFILASKYISLKPSVSLRLA